MLGKPPLRYRKWSCVDHPYLWMSGKETLSSLKPNVFVLTQFVKDGCEGCLPKFYLVHARTCKRIPKQWFKNGPKVVHNILYPHSHCHDKTGQRVILFPRIPVNITCNGHFLPVNRRFSRTSEIPMANSQKTAKSNKATSKAQVSRRKMFGQLSGDKIQLVMPRPRQTHVQVTDGKVLNQKLASENCAYNAPPGKIKFSRASFGDKIQNNAKM